MLCLATVSSNQLFSAENNNPAGGLDPSFALYVQRGGVEAIAVQPDGRLLVGGQFQIPGVGTNLVRFTQDGAPDPTFVPVSGVPWHVTKLALQPDGRILVGNKGGFDGTSPAIGLSRFLPDGGNDSSFRFRLPTNSINDGIWSGFWATALTVQPDGKILLAGYYERHHSDYEYWSALTLQRLLPDGSGGTFFRPSPQYIGALVLLPDQRLLLAGDQLVRLNADGTEDAGFVKTILPDPGFSPTVGIECCITQPDGRILIGGNFTNIQGHARCRIARIMPDGRLDLSFNPPVNTRDGEPYYTAIRALALQPDGRVLVGGNFETMNGLPYVALARLNSDGNLDPSFPPVLRLDEDQDVVTVSSIVVQDGDRAIIGGGDPAFGAWDLFRIYLGEPALRLAIRHVSVGGLQLTFNYSGSNDFTVLSTTNLSLPASEWTVLGSATNIGAGMYQFTDRFEKSDPQLYYQLRWMDRRQQR
jgi:uncharacterized delta-60 repeat protein